ncbi:TPA: lipid-A-disaccharide synthase N-terminal domain-containing protein [Legionella feeleii]|uniref:Lipid-A-disaccharide synthase n=1 Tax=Legionella feeleii TaxID=453 RepID=A0A0W0THA6_9GAMM|nr:lipid-A-disaccharide synthase N-terminal domain-containing protein [Legionella feeleii]KTC94963.1 lipid-A-disaccharide synthase [Legionella feeleii]SPX60785.1 lipid-A-disaccharide synthase [Legionella feeleii]STX38015.1 lipid-A-disaccharide synthase [Legionella feeleii]
MNVDYLWLTIGFIGQGIFSARFVVQWLISEKVKRSVIPVAFWYLSLFGGLTLLVYSIYKQDPVFILGQSTGVFIYARNLYLIQRERSSRITKKLKQVS